MPPASHPAYMTAKLANNPLTLIWISVIPQGQATPDK
jgi:hypothetical protein